MRRYNVVDTTARTASSHPRTPYSDRNTIAVEVLPTQFSPALLHADSRTLSPKGRRIWTAAQFGMLFAGAILVGLLLFQPELGLSVMWRGAIFAAPAMITVAPGLWRNICPMATVHQLPKRLGLSLHKKMPEWMAAALGLLSVTGLFIIVPMRHIGLNSDGAMTAVMLMVAATIAFGMGALFEARCGWCTTLCPIHPVEKLYGTVPAIAFKNARCDLCENCTTPCPDSTPGMSPVNTGTTRLQQFLGRFVVGSFPGFVWGWYQVKDLPADQVGFSDVLTAYAWPLGAALASFLLFTRAERALRRHESARHALHRAFAAAAVSIYYWFRLPGPVALLPDWYPTVYHIGTTSFFFWFLVVRSPKGVSWLIRPTMSSAYWSSLYKRTSQNGVIHAGPTKEIRT